MRITNSLFYATSTNEHQRAMKQMYDIDTQLSSAMKIQNSYEDSGIYVDTMRLNYEIATLEQSKETSSKAQTFANNTDATMNQIEDALEQFKTKLIQANSSVHSSTSLNAIADELDAIKTHLITLGNTSINGQFLFSGSALLQKPLQSDGTYVGNGEKLNATIGSDVELPYNIDGQSLFLGIDNDYNRIVSTNVPMYNQSLLHPDVMVLNSGTTASKEVYLTAEDTIRDMVGDTDNIATTDSNIPKDPNAVFHVSGRRPDGVTFNTAIEMQSHEKVSVLLEKIGQSFGNTPTNKVVDVSMNDRGQIEIKDLKPGNQLLEFHMVGAVDRTALPGSEGNADELNLISKNVQIVEFIKSSFKSSNASSSISSRQDIFSPGQFTLGAPMFQSNGEFVDSSTKLRSFMGDEINQIKLSGKNNSGTSINPIPPLDVLRIDDNTTVQQLLSAVESAYGVSARLEDGQIYLSGGSTTDFSSNKLAVTLDAYKFAGDGEVQSFSITNGSDATVGQQIGLSLSDGVTLYNVNIPSNATPDDIAQAIVNDQIAIKALDSNIKSIRTEGSRVIFDYNDNAGVLPANVTVTSLPSTVTTTSTTKDSIAIASGLPEIQMFEIKEDPLVAGTITIEGVTIAFNPSVPFNHTKEDVATLIAAQSANIILANPNISSITANANKLTIMYNNVGNVSTLDPITVTTNNGNHDIDGNQIPDLIITNESERTLTEGSGPMLVNAFSTFDSLNYNDYNFNKDGNKLESNVSQIIKKTNEYAVASTKLIEVAGTTSLNDRAITFDFINRNGIQSHGKINLEETSPYSTFQIDFDNSGTYEENEILPLYNANGVGTKASEVTYKQVMDVISLATSGVVPSEKVSMANALAISNAITISLNPTSTSQDIKDAIAEAKKGVGTETAEYIQKAIEFGIIKESSTSTPTEIANAQASYDEALKDADLSQYSEWIETAQNSVEVYLDHRGRMVIKDKINSNSSIQLSLKEQHAYAINDKSSTLSFMANDAVKIEDPAIDFFANLDDIISSVRRGEFEMNAKNANPRSLGINNALNQLNHILDHVTKEHTKIGSFSNALSDASERVEFLALNVKTVRSEVIDVDIAEAYLQFNQISNSYQAMLSTISKINSMSLLNYM